MSQMDEGPSSPRQIVTINRYWVKPLRFQGLLVAEASVDFLGQ